MPATTPPAQTEQELLERYAALAFDKQNDVYEVIGDNSWNVDMTAGTISFGPQLVFPMQVLGSFSHSSETWLWAWANEQSDLPEPLLAQARQLRAYGEQYSIELLTVSQFDATQTDLHAIGSIASGMFGASGYYLANYGQGTLVVTIQSEQIDEVAKNDFARITTVFPQVISVFEMRHRPAFIHYLSAKGYAIAEAADAVTATVDAGTLTATFDSLERLTNLQGTGGR
ncbi:hypothetical protein Q5H93_12200 [Hymenobacter sp. ASUV-10]|uniref:Uncharacterized protein n=1 Tax=Hymenobacter aranciens TaxID=3063996 RepID=A0ABT9BB55_9BACT|nr:DUF6882 domain-containing protein [Hymenobacter sp. ASUV-10]MDO7875496.1 hypothetical protein [Hymenobacter sp. ASUV-10]